AEAAAGAGSSPSQRHSFEVPGRASAGQGASGQRGHQWPAALHRLAEGSGVSPP
ncbi:unnamed protein product, partial [Urochloa humidicola]